MSEFQIVIYNCLPFSLRIFYNTLKEKMFFSSIFRFLIECYLEIAICTLINIRFKVEEKKFEIVSIIYSYIFFSFCSIFPVFIFIFLTAFFNRLSSDTF